MMKPYQPIETKNSVGIAHPTRLIRECIMKNTLFLVLLSSYVIFCCGCEEKKVLAGVLKQDEPTRFSELTNAITIMINENKDINVPQEFCGLSSDLGDSLNRIIQKQKYTPLHVATMFGTLEAVQLLVAHNADIEVRDAANATPLHRGAQKAFSDTCKFLIESGAEVNTKDISGNTPIFWLIPPHERSWNITNVLEICLLLINAGAEVNILNESSYTPLHRAVTTPHPEIVEFLIRHGARVDITTGEGNTPLHAAMLGGEIETLKLLLDHGADINARNKFGKTPLSEAKFFMNNGYTTEDRQKEIIQLLKSRGAIE